MIALIQRVSQAEVKVGNETTGAIDSGLLALIGVQKTDTEEKSARLLEKLLAYRMFADEEGQMNLSVKDIKGGVLLVPQFTLAADTQKGLRPSFSSAAPPEIAKKYFDNFVMQARAAYERIEVGVFGADMQVALVNDGPVTFWLQV